MTIRLLAIGAACAATALGGLSFAAQPALAAPSRSIDPRDGRITLTGQLRKINGHYKIRKNNVPHLLDVSAVPLRASHLIGRNVRVTGYLRDSTVNGVESHVFVVTTMVWVR